MRLAYTGAVKEDVIDTETLACHFIALLAKYYPQTLSERYKLEAPEGADGIRPFTAGWEKSAAISFPAERSIPSAWQRRSWTIIEAESSAS